MYYVDIMKNLINIIFVILVFIFIADGSFATAEDEGISKRLYINEAHVVSNQAVLKSIEFNRLAKALLEDEVDHYDPLVSVNARGDTLELQSGFRWSIPGANDQSIAKKWKAGDKIKIEYHSVEGHQMRAQLTNMGDSSSVSKALHISSPTKYEVIQKIRDKKIFFKSGKMFESPENDTWIVGDTPWKAGDKVVVLYWCNQTTFVLWNMTCGRLCMKFNYAGQNGFGKDNILTLEDRLNALVLDQPEVSKTVVKSLMNYAAGLNDPDRPVGVFLFLGPTGVGKTEFAKALSKEVFGTKNLLVHLDMTGFSEKHTTSGLIGSPPGFVGSEEGGQLTNPLLENPERIILLDEMEKAHANVHKLFLPVFDEGHIYDSKGKFVNCKQAIFIMTSNLNAARIVKLFEEGYTEQEVLAAIEPDLIANLSPELYNRVEPIVFKPLGPETIQKLVGLMLDQVAARLKAANNMTLEVDPSVKTYLAEHGFQPELGARPLKRLIEKQVVACISYAIISEDIPNGATVTLFYSPEGDAWHVAWETGPA